LNGLPHGVEYLNTAPVWDSTFTGQIIYTADTKKVYVGTDTAFVELTPNSATHTHDDIYYRKVYVDGLFDISSGHDHDGSDSKKVSYQSLDSVPSSFVPSVHDNSAHSGSGYITGEQVTYSLLAGNVPSVVGTGATQVAQGNHNHDAVYPLKTDLAATTTSTSSGASSIGVYDIMNQANVQDALESVVDNFSNYTPTGTAYTTNESDNKFVTLNTNQLINSSKALTGTLSVNAAGIGDIPLSVFGDSSGKHAFFGDNTISPSDHVMVDIGKTYSGNLATMQIKSINSILNIDHDLDAPPISVNSIFSDIRLNSTENLTGDIINGALVSVSHMNTGTLTSTSVIRSKFNNTSANINETVKLIETVSTIDAGNVNNLYSLYVNPVQGTLASSVIGNNYGLYIGNQKANAVTNGYAIYTNSGSIRFGDDVTVASRILPEGSSNLIGDVGKYFNSSYITTMYLDTTHQIKVGTSSATGSSEVIQISNGSDFKDLVTEDEIYKKSYINLNYWTKTQLSTTGNPSIEWTNILNAPSFGSPTWKSSVATPDDLPMTGNSDGDIRTVDNDGDDKPAQYAWSDGAWVKIADIDWGDSSGIKYDDHTSITNDVHLNATNVQDAIYSVASNIDAHEKSSILSESPHDISLANLGAAPVSHSHNAGSISMNPPIAGYSYSDLQLIIVDFYDRIKTLENKVSTLNDLMFGSIDGGGADEIFTEYAIDGGSADPLTLQDDPINGGSAI